MAQNQKVKRGPKVGTHHTEEHRANIDAAKLIKRLQMNALGQLEHEMTPGQIRSAEILLRKSLPDLVQAEITDEFTHRYVIEAPAQLTREQWIQEYSPPMIEEASLKD